ncbi:MAG TPA: response regulator [Candidatus Omnitrophota bacterium]|nr:response regulator [Candidatus Omnitrophota bacterium]
MPDTILIVDDDAEFRSELHSALDCYDEIEAASGKEAMYLLRKPNQIDLVLLDVMMPGSNGTDVLREMKRYSPRLAIVMLTGYSSKDVAVEALKGHADEYIEKPLDIDKTKEIIERLLQARRGESDAAACGRDGKIGKVKRFIERNAQKKVTLKDAAQAVFLSPKYLSRIFKQETGMGFNEYKLKLMIERAKDLLAGTGFTISQISDRLGYQNAESFIRIFEKMTGMAPTRFRIQCRLRKQRRRHRVPARKRA